MSTFTSDDLSQLKKIRKSVADFKAMLDSLPASSRNLEYNSQFNELRSEAKALLKGPFTEDVPRAITGDVSRDRSLSVVVILGVVLALIGFGVNSIILEDVLVNSLGCCVSSGGMLLVLGALGVMLMRNVRERVTTVDQLSYRCDLLLYQLDHRLYMEETTAQPQTPPPSAVVPPDLAPPESDEF
jgi:hypothetical protein